MQYDYKIVRFDEYCSKCKYKNVKDQEGEQPCNECLQNPVNLHSVKPVKFEEIEKHKKRKGMTFGQIAKYTFKQIKKLTFGDLKGDD